MRYCLHVTVFLEMSMYILIKIQIFLPFRISVRKLTNNWKVSTAEEKLP